MADKVFLVIGGSRGIGAAVAESAAERGYIVVLTYSASAGPAATLVDRLRAKGGVAHAVHVDVASEAGIIALFEAASAFGPIAVMVYSSGITGASSPLADASAETLRSVIDVNLIGAMLSAREAVRRMSTDRGGAGGSIVLLSSRASLYGSAGEYVWYAASKGGLDSFATGLAREVAGQGIRVNLVSPGPVGTEMLSPERQAIGAARVPMQRVGTPAEIAEAVMFLASPAASYVTGANLAVSGGV